MEGNFKPLAANKPVARIARFLILAFLFLTGCEKGLPVKDPDVEKERPVSFSVAASDIDEFAASHFEISAYSRANTLSRDNQKNGRTSASTEVILFSDENEIERVEAVKDADGTVLLFVLNYRSKNKKSDKKGFVVMSADRRAIPVLAWSDESSLNTGDMAEGMEMWLGYAKEVVRRAKRQKEPGKQAFITWKRLDEYLARKNGRITECRHPNPQMCNPCNADWDVLVGPVVSPNSRWGQGQGYNNSMWNRACGPCGRARVGCAAVAMGMIMRFDQKPSAGYNFNAMPVTVRPLCSGFTQGELQVSWLLYNLSSAMNSSNAPLGCATFTLPGKIPNGFSWAGYSKTGNWTSDIGMMENETQFGRPVLMGGTTSGGNLDDSHYWVCDGYHSVNYCYSYSGLPEDCQCMISTFHHIVWGWGDQDNGWFTLGNLNPGGTGAYDSWLRVRVAVKP